MLKSVLQCLVLKTPTLDFSLPLLRSPSSRKENLVRYHRENGEEEDEEEEEEEEESSE
jgi:hypothetical protein